MIYACKIAHIDYINVINSKQSGFVIEKKQKKKNIVYPYHTRRFCK